MTPTLQPETPTATATATATAAVDRYLAALNEPDPVVRRSLVEAAWAPDGGLTDPPIAGQGHDGLAQVGDALHAHYPGHAFRRTSEVDGHSGRFRFSWALTGPDGTVAMTGMDTGELAPDGRAGQVVGFFGELVARSDG
jgi:hypothetical protein